MLEEAGVLTAAILQGRYTEVQDLGTEAFEQTPQYHWIHEVAQWLKKPDLTLLASEARNRGMTPDWVLLNELENAFVPEDLSEYKARFREAVAESRIKEAMAATGAGNMSLSEMRSVQDHWESYRMGGVRVYKSAKESLQELRDSLVEGSPRGISTGYGMLDAYIGGWRPGGFYVLSGYTGHGKTALALNAALHAAEHGKVVAIHSFEMMASELFMRLLAIKSGVPAEMIERKSVSDAQRGALSRAWSSLESLPILTDDNPVAECSAVCSKVREAPPDIVIIDYLHLMRGTGENRQLEIAGMSRDLKLLAMELGIPVIALGQLKQPPQKKDGELPLPGLGAVRDSGAPEQDCHASMIIHRDEDKFGEGIHRLLIPKNRTGMVGGHVDFSFSGETYTFHETIGGL